MNEVNFKIGDKVRYLGHEEHKQYPEYYPPVGTVGTIVEVDDDSTALVNWGKVGSICAPYSWWVRHKEIELVNEG